MSIFAWLQLTRGKHKSQQDCMTEGHEPSSRLLAFLKCNLESVWSEHLCNDVTRCSSRQKARKHQASPAGHPCPHSAATNWAKNRRESGIFCSVMSFIILTCHHSSSLSCNLTVKVTHSLKEQLETGPPRSNCSIYKLIAKFKYREPCWQFKGTRAFLCWVSINYFIFPRDRVFYLFFFLVCLYIC